MAKETFKAVDREYTFDTHRVGYGYTRFLAVNVKYRGPWKLKLSDEHQRKLERIVEHDDGPTEDALRQRAEEATAENWWDWARDRAKELKLGPVHSEGRSGGWLVLENWPLSGIETTCEAEQIRCVYCDKEEEEHVGGQCLFQATYFKAATKLHVDSQETLDDLTKYCDQLDKSVEGIVHNVIAELEYVIDETLAELELECENPGTDTSWTSLPPCPPAPPVIEST